MTTVEQSAAAMARYVAELEKEVQALRAKCESLRESYHELLFAVGNKYTGETRHQTALRYIRAAEKSNDAAMGGREQE